MTQEVDICGIKFKNPVIAASGTFGFGREYAEYIDINRLGGISSKGLTLHKNPGNEGIRLYETPAGLMNSIGLQNPGVEAFIKEELPFLLAHDTVTIANLGGHSVEDYVEGARLLNDTEVKIIELNISCPNVKEGGMAFGTDPKKSKEVISKVREVTDKKLMVKLSPNVGHIGDYAKLAEDCGADSVSLVNTFNALAIDIYKRKAVFNNKTAGLSGPAIKPIALRMVNEVANSVKIPVVGMGGIMNAEDAIEFIMAGATAVQVGTANFVNFNTMIDIIDGIEEFMEKENIKSLQEITNIIWGDKMNKTIELLKKSEALLGGHFLLSSGRHSNKYVQCAKLIQHPKYCQEVAEIIAEKIKEAGIEVDLCVGPAMGGIIISYEVARALGTEAIFTERVDNQMCLRRGFHIEEGTKVIIVEDVITTGKSSFESVKVIEDMGGEVVALTSIVNRSGKDEINSLPIISATKLNIETWAEDELPEELKNTPAVKPGSRKMNK